MNSRNWFSPAQLEIAVSGRIALATLVVCCLAYGLAVWAFAQAVVPGRAEGSLLRDAKGNVLGSALIAQKFSRPEYFWPRPSACGFQAGAAGGSNLSPASPVLRERAQALAARYGADGGRRLPADLATASGSGLDPHITRAGAAVQVERIAAARGVDAADVTRVLDACEERAGGPFAPLPLVNVLRVNLALDRGSQQNERRTRR